MGQCASISLTIFIYSTYSAFHCVLFPVYTGSSFGMTDSINMIVSYT